MPAPPDLEDFLSRPLFAHLATASEDGPRESPVWFLWEDGAVWMIAGEKDTFWRRIAADERCAIGIVDFDVRTGLVQHVGMRGKATIQPWEPDRMRRLLARYLGEDADGWPHRFRAAVDDHTNRWVRFVSDSTVVRDQSYGDASAVF